MKKKPVSITLQTILDFHPCDPTAVEKFFGNHQSLKITLANCKRAAKAGLDLNWLAKNWFKAPAYKAYQEAIAPAYKAWQEATAPAYKAWHEATAPAYKAYQEATATAYKAWQEATAPAFYAAAQKMESK